MSVPAEPSRARADACPGALTTHAAADGRLARVRVPGGQLTASQLRALAACAADLGDGALHLTSRANLQLRGLDGGDELAQRLAGAGLLPSLTHERVRNVVASPLSGLTGGRADVRALVPVLDRAICARPELAALPGRFLFGVDDGRADIVDARIDVCWQATGAEMGRLLLAGQDSGLPVARSAAVGALIAAAVAFSAVRGDAWQVRELDAERRQALVPDVGGRSSGPVAPESRQPTGREPGVLGGRNGSAVIAGLVFGVLSADQARLISTLASSVVITPWRTVVLPDVPACAVDATVDALVAAGLVVDAGAPEMALSACIGRRGCAKSLADVRADATKVAAELTPSTDGRGVAAHFSGCARRCGRPGPETVDVLADGDGYLVDGHRVPVERIAEALAKGSPG